MSSNLFFYQTAQISKFKDYYLNYQWDGNSLMNILARELVFLEESLNARDYDIIRD